MSVFSKTKDSSSPQNVRIGSRVMSACFVYTVSQAIKSTTCHPFETFVQEAKCKPVSHHSALFLNKSQLLMH